MKKYKGDKSYREKTIQTNMLKYKSDKSYREKKLEGL